MWTLLYHALQISQCALMLWSSQSAWQVDALSVGAVSVLTPANDGEDPQVVLVGEEGHEDQAVQVEPLHQNPVVVGGQEIKEKCHNHLAAHLWSWRNGNHIRASIPLHVPPS